MSKESNAALKVPEYTLRGLYCLCLGKSVRLQVGKLCGVYSSVLKQQKEITGSSGFHLLTELMWWHR